MKNYMQRQRKEELQAPQTSGENTLQSNGRGNHKKKKLANESKNVFKQMQRQRQIESDNSSNSMQVQQASQRKQNSNKINYFEYTPKTLRRVQKQGKYAPLQTLSMDLLRRESLYEQSKQFAQKIGVSQHKNYFITALRLSLLYHHKVNKGNSTIEKVIDQIFEYIQQKLRGCVEKKYQNKNLISLTILKNKNDINVFKKVFESDLSKYQNVFELVKGLYDCKSNGEHSQTHIKNADKLTKIIMRVAKDGTRYSQPYDPSAKFIPDLVSCCKNTMQMDMEKKQSNEVLSDIAEEMQNENSDSLQHNSNFQAILKSLDEDSQIVIDQLMKQGMNSHEGVEEQIQEQSNKLMDFTSPLLDKMFNLEIISPRTPLTPNY